ncbi:hypothetical protein MNBD_GAMMA10-3255, partial [hydrothermal vent metagenome]
MVMPYNPAIGRFVVIASKVSDFIKWTQKVVLTPGWFVEAGNTYPPRPGNIMKPLINGERAFASVYEALDGAKK